MTKIFEESQALGFQKILMIILDHYLTHCAVAHCLTSKRIESTSMKMHLQGLRNLRAEVAKLKKLIE
jgi:hypothetical protein